MTLDDAYGWIAAPLKVLELVEETLNGVGIPVGPFGAQCIVLGAAMVLAGAFGYRYWQRGEESRLPSLLSLIGFAAIAIGILSFWTYFKVNPPSGEVTGRLQGDHRSGWRIRLYDHRDTTIADAIVSETQQSFSIFYEPTFGVIPARLVASQNNCEDVPLSLTPAQVFEGAEVEMELSCTSP